MGCSHLPPFWSRAGSALKRSPDLPHSLLSPSMTQGNAVAIGVHPWETPVPSTGRGGSSSPGGEGHSQIPSQIQPQPHLLGY